MTQKVERLRFPVAPGRTIPGGVTPELDQPGLVGMQLQTELRESLPKIDQEPLGVRFVLEPGHKVIGKPHDDHLTVGVTTPPLTDPPVEDIVEIDVGQKR